MIPLVKSLRMAMMSRTRLTTGNRKPPAKRNKPSGDTTKRYCEYCGRKGHATRKSKKCLAFDDNLATKKYRREDGSLLATEPAAATTNEDEEEGDFVIHPTILNDDHERNCKEMDIMPFDNEVQDDDSDLDLFHHTTTWDEDKDDEDDGTLQTGVFNCLVVTVWSCCSCCSVCCCI
jgi:hypothetical protein